MKNMNIIFLFVSIIYLLAIRAIVIKVISINSIDENNNNTKLALSSFSKKDICDVNIEKTIVPQNIKDGELIFHHFDRYNKNLVMLLREGYIALQNEPNTLARFSGSFIDLCDKKTSFIITKNVNNLPVKAAGALCTSIYHQRKFGVNEELRIIFIFVAKEFQRMGLGRLLFNTAFQCVVINSNDFKSGLHVSTLNIKGLKLYASLGYRIADYIQDYYNGLNLTPSGLYLVKNLINNNTNNLNIDYDLDTNIKYFENILRKKSILKRSVKPIHIPDCLSYHHSNDKPLCNYKNLTLPSNLSIVEVSNKTMKLVHLQKVVLNTVNFFKWSNESSYIIDHFIKQKTLNLIIKATIINDNDIKFNNSSIDGAVLCHNEINKSENNLISCFDINFENEDIKESNLYSLLINEVVQQLSTNFNIQIQAKAKHINFINHLLDIGFIFISHEGGDEEKIIYTLRKQKSSNILPSKISNEKVIMILKYLGNVQARDRGWVYGGVLDNNFT